MQKPVVLALYLVTTLVCRNGFGEALAPVDSPSDEAIVLGQSGMAKFSDERWQLALDEFRAADAKMHSPVFGLYIARCLRNQGRWADAFAQYRTLVSSAYPEAGPEPWQLAYRNAKDELAELRATIPRLQFRMAAGTDLTPSIRLDGRDISFEEGPKGLMLDPGAHTLEVTHNGRSLEVRQLVLHPARESLTITLGPYPIERAAMIPNPPPIAIQASASGTGQPASLGRKKSAVSVNAGTTRRDVRSIALGVGFVGLAVGAVAGFFAWSERSNISRQCDNHVCPSELSWRIERGKLLADGTTVALVTSAVSFAVAGVLFYVEPSASNRKNAGVEYNGLQVGFGGRY